MIDEREPVVPPLRGPGACRGRRVPVIEAHLVDHDDDAAGDSVSIDPLEDRESRCAGHARSIRL
jgi:hypothetical protein